MTTTETLDLAPYSEVKAAIAKMKSESAGLTFDYETPKGNKLARSHVASLRTVKGDIERKRKELKADALEYGRKVDAVAKELSGEIEAMIEVHQGPLNLIESREEARKLKHLNNVAALIIIPGVELPNNSAACRTMLTRIKGVIVDDAWQEFKTQALEAQAASVRQLETHMGKLLKSEAEAEELARLRKEREEQEAKERAAAEELARARREEEIRAAAETKARREAEAKAEAERQRVETAARVERERADREASARLEAEREKTRKAEVAAEKAKREKAEAEAKAAREEQAKRDAETKRAANAKHRAKVLHEAAEDILAVTTTGSPMDLAEAIAAGKIRHVKVEF